MSRGRIEFEPAVVLSQRPYRETSELLELFSRTQGRVVVVARGARGPKSKLRGVLAPFAPLLLSWTEAGELGTLVDAEAAGPPVVLAGERIFHGWYANELLLKLLHRHDPHPELYDDYLAALAGFAADEMTAEAALRIFEKRLLERLGYGLPLDTEFESGSRYGFVPGTGFTRLQPGDERLSGWSGATLAALRDERLGSRETLREARMLLRVALEPQVPHASLRTPALLRQLRQAGVR